MSYGLVVEGDYDKEIIPEIVRRIIPSATVRVLACGGKSKFRKLAGYLNDLRHARRGHPVDKVLVVEDCDQRPVQDVENELARLVPSWASDFPRGVQVCGVRQAIESWLMVDASAIMCVARAFEAEGGQVHELNEDIEEIVNPKPRFKRMLSEAGLPYTPEVCRTIAEHVDLNRLRLRSPSFRSFERKVTDC